MKAKARSLKQLAIDLSVDHRTLRRRLAKEKPAGRAHGGPTYTVAQATKAMADEPLRNTGTDGERQGKEALLAEQIRKLRIQNNAKEATLIPRSVVFAQRAKLASLFVAAGHRVVNEGSMTIAARLGLPDIAQCRAVVRDAVTMMGELVHGFADELMED